MCFLSARSAKGSVNIFQMSGVSGSFKNVQRLWMFGGLVPTSSFFPSVSFPCPEQWEQPAAREGAGHGPCAGARGRHAVLIPLLTALLILVVALAGCSCFSYHMYPSLQAVHVIWQFWQSAGIFLSNASDGK